MRITTRAVTVIILLAVSTSSSAADLAESLLFHASFDHSAEADVAVGDAAIYTAKNLDRQEQKPGLPPHVTYESQGGRWGGCLRFADVSDQVVMYRGQGNVPCSSEPHDATVSLWLRVDPENGLQPGYVDPLQITDKKWNDASLFLDFTKDDKPRQFRLGVFSDFKFWNPENKNFDDISAADRPMVVVQRPPFAGDRWTHVAFTLSRVNGRQSVSRLWVDGHSVGDLHRDQRLSWNASQVAIMLGIQYIGDIDDLAVFDRALNHDEILLVMNEGVTKAIAGDAATADTATHNTAAASMPRAFIDGTGEGWRSLGEQDFVNVNCDQDTWSWKDGTAYCTGNPVGVIRSPQMIRNFELVCEWKHKQKGGNSGVFVWATQASIDRLAAGNGRLPEGIEVQVLDLGYKAIYEDGGKRKADWFTSHGDVFPTGAAKMKPFPPVAPDGKRSFPSKNLTKGLNQWNHYYVRAIQGEVRLWVNGEEVSGGTNCEPSNGYLCLESEGAPVEFRNLRIRVLP